MNDMEQIARECEKRAERSKFSLMLDKWLMPMIGLMALFFMAVNRGLI